MKYSRIFCVAQEYKSSKIVMTMCETDFTLIDIMEIMKQTTLDKLRNNENLYEKLKQNTIWLQKTHHWDS